MDILVTLPDAPKGTRTFFTDELIERLEALGTVTWNESAENLTPAELADRLSGTDVCFTGWGTPRIDRELVESVDEFELRLLTHVAGSIPPVASEYLYDVGVEVCSANEVMAKFVGEYLLGAMLTSLRSFREFDADMKSGEWNRVNDRVETLFGKTVGFVGLGTIGEYLLAHLRPFDVEVLVYDPYVSDERLAEYDFVERADLETVMAESDVVSLHASKTEETVHMIGEDELALLRDGALLVNAARGALVDTEALVSELRTGRISAVLDVYETKPLPADSELRDLDSVILTPHMAGSAIRRPFTAAMIDEIARFKRGEALRYAIPREQYELMTRPWIAPEER